MCEPQVPCSAGAPVVAHWVLEPLGAEEQRRCAAGAPGLAPCVLRGRGSSERAVLAPWPRPSMPRFVQGTLQCVEGVQKAIICHVFGENKLTTFNAQKAFRRQSS